MIPLTAFSCRVFAELFPQDLPVTSRPRGRIFHSLFRELVTDNLYSKIRMRDSGDMGSRAAKPVGTPHRVRRQTSSFLKHIRVDINTKSLFQNTLPVSALCLRLYGRRMRPLVGNYLGWKILRIFDQNYCADLFANGQRGGAPHPRAGVTRNHPCFDFGSACFSCILAFTDSGMNFPSSP